MITVTKKVHFATQHRRRRMVDQAPVWTERPQARIPRISRLMALAIRFDQLIRDGAVKDMSELACLAHVTQPRMTQIMNLLHLATDIQEELLNLPPASEGRDSIHERLLRPACAELSWRRQRQLWVDLKALAASG